MSPTLPLAALALVLAPSLAQAQVVLGLEEGERVTLLAPDHRPALPAGAQAPEREGRVVDARNGLPLAGVRVEAWTEEITEPGRGARRVGADTTGVDGIFHLPVVQGGLSADKVLLFKRGYLTFPGTLGDLDLVRLVPAPEVPARLLALDLDGHPIQGARITSTYSCAHDVPALSVRTDAQGVATLPGYGLQAHPGQLRVLAPGYAGIKYLHVRHVLADAAQPAVVRLARRAPVRLRVLDREGVALGHQALRVLDGDGYHVAFSDGDGGLRIDARYDGSELSIQLLGSAGHGFVYSGPLPTRSEVSLRVDSEVFPEELPRATLALTLGARLDGREAPEMVLFHEGGWTATPRLGEDGVARAELPAGEATLLLGGPFSPWREATAELQLQPGEEHTWTPSSALQLEPVLSVSTPPGEASALIVQAGADSLELEVPADGLTSTHVPAGAPITLMTRGKRTRLLTLGPVAEDTSVSLLDPQCLLPREGVQQLEGRERVQRSLRVVSAGDRSAAPVSAAKLSSQGVGETSVEQDEAGDFRVQAPADTPVHVDASASGHASAALTLAALGDVDVRNVVELTPLAQLELESELDFVVEGPLAERLGELHPGPLSLVVRLADGRRIGLFLELGPGQTRRISIAP